MVVSARWDVSPLFLSELAPNGGDSGDHRHCRPSHLSLRRSIVADENSMGTNNESLREDPLYLGLRRPRVELKEAREFMDEFMGAVSAQWPKTVIQHEDL